MGTAASIESGLKVLRGTLEMKLRLGLIGFLVGIIFSGGSYAAQYCGTYNGQAIYQELAGRTCKEAMDSARGFDSSQRREQSMRQFEDGLQQLNKIYNSQPEDPLELQRQREAGEQSVRDAEEKNRVAQEEYRKFKEREATEFEDVEKSFNEQQGDTGWQARANQKVVTPGCDCREVTGACMAKIALKHVSNTGADYEVRSNESRCSKVSYYIDSTPYISIISNGNAVVEHSASQKKLTLKNFSVEKCEVCSYDER
ncbi:hypothetical protein PPUJ20028_41320 [Pseudomonas putida]|nr:hypothetical protein PPUJ20028_41320 [Pseudomonas putida]